MDITEEQIIPPPVAISSLAKELALQINVPEVLAAVLVHRGIDSFEKAKLFFRPALDQLHNPFLMQPMQKAVQRILFHIEKNNLIAIYGDYDVDGISSCALLLQGLVKIGARVKSYLPNRLEEGYGLSCEGVREIATAGASLIITVDCGITAVKEAALAKELKIDLIVTDHHEPKDELPECFAILDPKLKTCSYPEKELAGVGVAFKLLQAVYIQKKMPPEVVYEYLDLVALGSAADIVPLTGENRILVKFGLLQMGRTKNIGLAELLKNSELLDKKLRTHHMVFSLAPMLNAVGRLGNPSRALHLLVSETSSQAANIVQLLKADNLKRRELDRLTTQEAMDRVETEIDLQNQKIIVLASENWHVGVIGIAASRLVEKYYRPVILISLDKDGTGKGSGRSIQGFDLHEALLECKDHLLKFGGHKYAAGLTLQKESLDKFILQMNRIASVRLKDLPLAPVISPCAWLNLADINPRLMRLLELMEPFGPGNARPTFFSDALRLAGRPTIAGEKHLKFMAVQGGTAFDVIAFGMAHRMEKLNSQANHFGLAFGLEENEWNGTSKIQLKVKGMHF